MNTKWLGTPNMHFSTCTQAGNSGQGLGWAVMWSKSWPTEILPWTVTNYFFWSLTYNLTQRVQRVFVNGHNPNFTHIKSGIPQGTFLGPLIFLLYINCGISSQLQLFVDDCILYWVIYNEQDSLHCKMTLTLILRWTETWQVNLNTSKCVILTSSRLLSTTISTIGDNNLHQVTSTITWVFFLTWKCHFHLSSLIL